MMDEDRGTPARRVWGRQAVRDLRRRATPTEQRLWAVLRDHRLDGKQFRRQHAIGPFFVDFVCLESRLVVEIDGPIHDEQHEYDAERDDYLATLGYTVLRFTTDRIRNDLNEVLSQIRSHCSAPPPHCGGEGGGGWGLPR